MFTNTNGAWWPIRPALPDKVKMRLNKRRLKYRELSRNYRSIRIAIPASVQRIMFGGAW